jgi:predicted dehydrogenase
MGFIGMGKQSRGLLKTFLGLDTRVLAVCDVDTTRREDAQATVNEYYKSKPGIVTGGCKAYNDFREVIGRDDIDAVVIATPDHWHAIPTIMALRAGKDVYCEKPLTHNIHEAITIMKEVDANKRVLQTGSMQRSMKEFRVACELVRNGVIGKISHIECSFKAPGIPCDLPEEKMEPGLDWDMWVGPAPMRGYNSILSPRGMHNHFPKWRDYREFGGGMVCDWGAHHLDIAQWGLGMDGSGPVEIRPAEKSDATEGGQLIYGNGIKVIHKRGFGVHFYGEDGEVKVNRGQIEFIHNGKTITKCLKGDRSVSLAAELIKVERAYLKNAKVKLYNSQNHPWDFMECVKSRKKPITSEQVGGRTAICCHLLNQAYYNHQAIKWDPAKLAFASGSGNPKWLTRDYRSPWKV